MPNPHENEETTAAHTHTATLHTLHTGIHIYFFNVFRNIYDGPKKPKTAVPKQPNNMLLLVGCLSELPGIIEYFGE